MRKIILFGTLLLCFCLAACGQSGTAADAAPESAAGQTEQDDAIIAGIISQFEELTQVPRPSHHEEQISAYLENWAREHGFDVTRDAYNNIVFDVPATEGREDQPMIALQTHMDMVFVCREGLELDSTLR